jgi:hypothetical protein
MKPPRNLSTSLAAFFASLFFLPALLLAQTGWTPELYYGIPDDDKQVMFFDEFDDNSNGWNLESRYAEMRISEGDFYCESKTDRPYVKRRFVPINQSGNYEIEISLRYVKGRGKEPLGLTFGRDVSGNEFNFYFSTDGKYRISKTESQREQDIVSWKKSSLLSTYSFNTLTVRKIEGNWLFFINREQVYKKRAELLFGYDIGFTVGGKMASEVDYLKISEMKSSDLLGPAILVSEPVLGRSNRVKLDKDQQLIRGRVFDPSGIQSLEINGYTVKPQENGEFVASLRLPVGQTPITIVALDNNNNKTTKVFYMEYEEERIIDDWRKGENGRGGKNYLLTIGINRYAYWNPLHNAIKDCQDLSSTLFQEYTFSPANSIHLLNEEATRENILEALESLDKKITPNDNLLIYYAGHGYYDTESKRGYWVPVKARQNKIADYIRNSTVHDYLKSIETHNTLLVVDACYAGSLFNRSRGEELQETNPSRWAFTSGDIEKVWDGEPGQNSPFAKYLIRMLRNNNKKKLRADDLIESVKTAVMHNTNQTPLGDPLQNVGDEGGVFIFFRR